MKTNFLHSILFGKFSIYAVFGLLLTSCGSYQNSSYYDNDGIYGNSSKPETTSVNRYSEEDISKSNKYKEYFGSYRKEYPEDTNEVFTDVAGYTSQNDSTKTQRNNYAGWGENNNENVTINIYNNDWGWNNWGWGWNNWYGPRWGWGWNSWAWNGGWGWNAGWDSPYWGWNSWYGPGWGWGWNGWYGYPYAGYYRNGVYNNGPRGGRYYSNSNRYGNSRNSIFNSTGRDEISRPRQLPSGTTKPSARPFRDTRPTQQPGVNPRPTQIPSGNSSTVPPRTRENMPYSEPRSAAPRNYSEPRSGNYSSPRNGGNFGGGNFGGGRSGGGRR